jgi:hypothetical protein
MLTNPFYINDADRLGRLLASQIDDANDAGVSIVDAVRSPLISMLSGPTLRAMHVCAREAGGVVLEIGAYVGGGTTVLLDGASSRGNPVITIEEPVRHSHPDIPTENSVVDLRRNVARLAPPNAEHTLLCGCSFEAWVLGELHHRLLGRRVGFLAWDADAAFERDVALVSPFLADQCILMVDDYVASESKSQRITQVVDGMIANDLVEPIAFLPWATWFGRLKRHPTILETQGWMREWGIQRSAGDPYSDRLLSYRERLDGTGPADAIPFEERQAFWKRASAWSAY